jgi:hypothetical protein
MENYDLIYSLEKVSATAVGNRFPGPVLTDRNFIDLLCVISISIQYSSPVSDDLFSIKSKDFRILRPFVDRLFVC